MRLKTVTWILIVTLGTSTLLGAQSTSGQVTPRGAVNASYGRLPLTFEANHGQIDPQVKFISRGPGYTAFLTSEGMVLALRSKQVAGSQNVPTSGSTSRTKKATLQFRLLGAARAAAIVGEAPQLGRVNYFIGKDPAKWRTNVPTYARVRYKNVYPGIDLVYYGSHQKLEYDFALAAGADPGKIHFEISGARDMRIDNDGSLVLATGNGEIHFQPPAIYQEANGHRVPVSGGYVMNGATHISFHVGNYDSAIPLVIDPVLVYSTYLGGSGDDQPSGIAVDVAGNVYVAGSTDSTDFPLSTLGSLPAGNTHVFVAKLDASGSNLIYADYLGGSDEDYGYALALDAANNVYLTGSTSSSDFPMVKPFLGTYPGGFDVFLSKISPDGSSLLYSTYLGGQGAEFPTSLGVDAAGEMVIAGYTSSTTLPVVNAYQSTVSANQGGVYGNYGFLTKFSADGSSLVYSTYFAGNSNLAENCGGSPCWPGPDNIISGVALDAAGNAYVAGRTNTYNFPVTNGAYLTTNSAPLNRLVGFVSKFNGSGGLQYSTYFYDPSSVAQVNTAIAVDAAGSAYITGIVIGGGSFPITSTSICDPGVSGSACNYAFVTKFDDAGATLAYSTFLGPNNNAVPQSIVLDENGNAYILAYTWSGLFDAVNGIENYNAGNDVLLVEIDPTASTQLFATYLGGSGNDQPAGMAIDASGNLYVAGVTDSSDLPVTSSAFQGTFAGNTDAFIVKIGTASAPAVSLNPDSLQYASQAVGTSSTSQNVLLRNMGSSPLTISSIAASGDFAETDNCGSSVPAAGSCTFTITFTPTAPGSRSGSISIQDDAAGSSHAINLSGSGLGATVSLTPSSLTFPSVFVGTTAAAQTITLANNGNLGLSISNIQVSGDYLQTNNCPASLAAGSTCAINVTFTPTGAGTRSGAVTFTDSVVGSPQSVVLTGTGVALGGAVTVTPGSLTFATQPAGTSSAIQTITLTNSGNAALSVNSIGASGDYSQTNTCSSSVPVGSSCSIKVTFMPTSSGTRKGTVTITDSAAGSPQTISLTGTGSDFSLGAASKSNTIKAGRTATYSVTVASVGGTFSNSVKMGCSGVPALTTCSLSPSSVIPGSNSVTVTVTIATTPTSAELSMPRSGQSQPFYALWMQLPGFGLLGVMLTLPDRRRKRVVVLIALLLLIGAMLFMSACAGGTGIAPQTIGTTPGTYSITVSGTSGSVQHSVPLTLTVQ